jgi:hypothetical protein
MTILFVVTTRRSQAGIFLVVLPLPLALGTDGAAVDLQGAGQRTRLAEAATLERHDARPPDDAPTPDDAWTLSTWI